MIVPRMACLASVALATDVLTSCSSAIITLSVGPNVKDGLDLAASCATDYAEINA